MTSNIAARYINAIANQLMIDGDRIIKKASMTNETTRRSGNMEDAYGAAVYYKRKRIKTTYVNPSPTSNSVHHGWAKHGIEDNTGRGYLDEFFNDFKPKTDGFVLVCVNAVYYAPILEDGAQARPQRDVATKYRIISQVDDEFNQLALKYKGKAYNLRGY